MNNFAHLKSESTFYPLFLNGWVPIVNIMVPNEVECIGDGVQEVYMVDLAKLSPEQFDLLAHLVHQQCDPSIPFAQAKREMLERGLPVRAKHVASVSSDVPFFL